MLGIGFGVVSIGILIGIIGYMLGTKNSQTVVNNQQNVNIPTLSPPSPTPVDETANWKTYANTKYKYSIKYPPDWNIENVDLANPEKVNFIKQPSEKDIDIHPQMVQIIVEKNPQEDVPTIEWYKNIWAKQIPAGINFDNVKFEETTFQGLPALKANNAIFFARNSFMFRMKWAVIDFGNADTRLIELNEQTFDQILATFQFTP